MNAASPSVGRKARIAQAFSRGAAGYDQAAEVQERVAGRLAERLGGLRLASGARILEIGCGTGLLSQHLADAFPQADLLLTDIAAPMLETCRSRLGGRGEYRLLDGERPGALPGMQGGGFDLIAASLVFQWFETLGESLARLAGLLAPGGVLLFATLLDGSLREWREAHSRFALSAGTPRLPAASGFPWPSGFVHTEIIEDLTQSCPDALTFLRGLKQLGANQPDSSHRPLGTGELRRVLSSLGNGFTVSFQVLYGRIETS